MKSATSPLVAHLAASKQFVLADLYTITLSNGAVYRFTSFDATLSDGSHTWLSGGPVINRTKTRCTIGLEVDTLELDVGPKDTDLLGSLTWFQAACSGALDGAGVMLERAFIQAGPSIIGTLKMFVGSIAQLTIDRSNINITVNSPLDILSVQMPRNLYQAGCKNTLFDVGCTLNRATFAVGGSVGGSITSTSFTATIAKPAGYFDLGSLQFTSGVLNGLRRTIKSWDGTMVKLLSPTPALAGAGDSFTIYPGCDKQQATCASSKFNNVVNFRGFPYIPVPETAL